jgi:hypothetical protein
MTNKDKNAKNRGDKQQDMKAKPNRDESQTDDYRSTNLRDSSMMAHLFDALEQGQDIGEYGRLTFAIIARHFLDEEEIIDLFANQPGLDEKEARALVLQVSELDYNPPKRERILQWMERQDFPICPDAEDPNGCNVYRDLQFPERIYEQINDFWEERAETEE